MRHYDNKLLAPRSVSNGQIPFDDEGPRSVNLILDFSTDAEIMVSLEAIQAPGQQGQIGQIQAIYIDNTRNAFALTMECLVTGQRITMPAQTEGVRQVFASMPAQFIFRSTISSASVVAQLLNVPLAPFTYGPLSVTANASAVTGSFVDFSGTITLGGTSQVLMPANALRQGLLIQNRSTEIESLWVNFSGAAGIGQPSFEIAPGGSWPAFNYVTLEQVQIIAATTGHPFTAKELV